MSELGKQIRLSRIFNHPSGRILSVAVDHFINYPVGLPKGLVDMEKCLDKIVEGQPSAITMNKGIAMRFMRKHAGKVPLIIQQVAVRSDDKCFFYHATVEEVVALGADAIAVSICVKNNTESAQLKHLSSVVTESEKFGLPVIAHIYPIGAEGESHQVSNLSEDIFYAVRIGLEMGVDVIKVPYTGSVNSFRDIVSVTPVPVIAAGGPKCETLEDTVKMIKDIAKSGSAGATVGRNAWGFDDVAGAINVLKKAMFEK